jgi:D-glycerate 3-kinase
MQAADIILAKLPAERRRPFVLGISGAQGSGKSTVARALADRLACPILSLDDLYLDGAARQRLAETVHPLLRTRGVPGTHDVARGLAILDGIGDRPMLLPRFDKARDEPGEPVSAGPADMLIFEGWCLGAQPEAEDALAAPVNTLERDQDPDGRWRRWVNARLAGEYRRLFERIDMLVFLAAPGFDIVADWRIEQERKAGGPMTDEAIRRFIRHYQRITRSMLHDLPGRAQLTIPLDTERRPQMSESRQDF